MLGLSNLNNLLSWGTLHKEFAELEYGILSLFDKEGGEERKNEIMDLFESFIKELKNPSWIF